MWHGTKDSKSLIAGIPGAIQRFGAEAVLMRPISCALAPVLLFCGCKRDAMTKAPYKRKHLTGTLHTVSEG